MPLRPIAKKPNFYEEVLGFIHNRAIGRAMLFDIIENFPGREKVVMEAILDLSRAKLAFTYVELTRAAKEHLDE